MAQLAGKVGAPSSHGNHISDEVLDPLPVIVITPLFSGVLTHLPTPVAQTDTMMMACMCADQANNKLNSIYTTRLRTAQKRACAHLLSILMRGAEPRDSAL